MKRVLITSAIPSVNGVKHLGNLVGSMLPADIFARFCRARGYETMAICATDEHGAPIELAAMEDGIPVSDYCDKWHKVQADLGAKFGLSWDHFGRSSSQQNHELTLHFARALWKNGHLETRVTKQAYSATDGRFLPDRYVIGTCPHCGYTSARGDQCENCTRVLDPIDLIEPRSAVSGAKDIEIRDSMHLFLKQSKFVDQLRAFIDSHKNDWPVIVTSIAYKWLDEGLHDRGITRDLEWGFPVPDDIADGALKGKVFYVWFDAPIEYIAATREWADKHGKGVAWRDWWYGDAAKDVTYFEFMGKDNVPFHTVGFPVTIMGSGEPWKLVDRLKGFNYLNFDGGKFSTSGKRGIFMDSALEIAPADYWRYYLAANAPEGSDSNFTWEHFAGVINKDLADVLGNFVNRVTKFSQSKFGELVPTGGHWTEAEDKLVTILTDDVVSLTMSLEDLKFRASGTWLRAVWARANLYLTSAAPWVMIKQNKEYAALATRVGLNLIPLIAELSMPFIPVTASALLNAVGRPDEGWPVLDYENHTDPVVHLENQKKVRALLQRVGEGDPFNAPPILVTKITEDQIAEWKLRFGGAS